MMKKKNCLLLLSAWLMCSAPMTAANDIKDLGDSKYSLQVGDLTMVVDAAHGGKILSFKHQDSEVISQLRWPESFGSTFWTSPQEEWHWPPVPEYDKRAYTVEECQDRLVIRSEVSEKLKFRICKEFDVYEDDNSISVTYSIINEDDKERKVAPWEITRVPNDGLIFFDAPVDGITPAGIMAFESAHGAAWYKADEAQENRKVNADGKGWLAYANNGLLMLKSFADLGEGQPAPGEAEIQVYVNRGKTYIELESQGAYHTLQPGEHLTWTVKWQLAPVDEWQQPSPQLLQKVEELRGMAD